jgi:hypothetical protein
MLGAKALTRTSGYLTGRSTHGYIFYLRRCEILSGLFAEECWTFTIFPSSGGKPHTRRNLTEILQNFCSPQRRPPTALSTCQPYYCSRQLPPFVGHRLLHVYSQGAGASSTKPNNFAALARPSMSVKQPLGLSRSGTGALKPPGHRTTRLGRARPERPWRFEKPPLRRRV